MESVPLSIPRLRHLTPDVITALDDLIERSLCFGGDYFQIYLAVQVEKARVRQIQVIPSPGLSIRLSNHRRSWA